MKKSRKKILLSSIAMLLVALVALGSATFAWFTINKTVEANTINVKAATAVGLEISNTQTDSFKRTVSYNSAYTELSPISYDDAVNSTFAAAGIIAEDVTKEDGGEYAANETGVNGWKSVNDSTVLSGTKTGETTYLYNASKYTSVYTMKVESSGAQIDREVRAKITVTNASTGTTTDGTTFAKAYLLDSSNKIVAFWTDGETYSPVADTNPTLGTAPTLTNNVKVLDTAPAQGSPATFKLVVWYEGNDPQCADAGQGAQVNCKVEFSLAD